MPRNVLRVMCNTWLNFRQENHEAFCPTRKNSTQLSVYFTLPLLLGCTFPPFPAASSSGVFGGISPLLVFPAPPAPWALRFRSSVSFSFLAFSFARRAELREPPPPALLHGTCQISPAQPSSAPPSRRPRGDLWRDGLKGEEKKKKRGGRGEGNNAREFDINLPGFRYPIIEPRPMIKFQTRLHPIVLVEFEKRKPFGFGAVFGRGVPDGCRAHFEKVSGYGFDRGGVWEIPWRVRGGWC